MNRGRFHLSEIFSKKYSTKDKNFTGFTLIELLIVIGIISILAAGVIVAINPGRQFASARDRTRERHVSSLQNALISYQVANQGNWGEISIPEEADEICNTGSNPNPDSADVSECIDLSPLVEDGHINSIPQDPSL